MAQSAGQVAPPAAAASPVARVGMGEVEAGRTLLDAPGVVALEIPRTPLGEAPYRDYVRGLLAQRPFRAAFNSQPIEEVLGILADQLLGGGFAGERQAFADDILALQAFAQALGGASPVVVTMRNYFAPGDLVWHVDRSHQRNALRIVWPLGRPGGMRVTPVENIDLALHRAFMSREYPLLYDLDRQIMQRPGATFEALWAHRPRQVAAMMAGDFPFLRDRAREFAIEPNAASVHRIDTPYHQGAYHRSSWENRHAPGLQVVMTAGEL